MFEAESVRLDMENETKETADTQDTLFDGLPDYDSDGALQSIVKRSSGKLPPRRQFAVLSAEVQQEIREQEQRDRIFRQWSSHWTSR